MLLSDLRILGEEGEKDILIGNEQITAVYDPANRPAGDQVKRLASDPANRPASDPAVLSLSFPGAIAFPGLINSHDHLDFNLFPASGYKIYGNYTEWGRDIHEKNAAGIRAVLKIPLHLRTRWGLYKNLLNGFTTVVNHGEKLMTGDEPVTVFQDYHCLHSVGFEKNWKWLLNRPSGRGLPFVVHVGEGTDKAAGREIDRLVHWNLFKRPLIGVHGVAMNEAQAAFFKALVWCPASNYFLLGQTAPVDRL
ncbi:MAG TPA: hypothetical protein VK563_00525, partial [Puia sp.]|nr:hypothetical protein [Puia sp.]